VRRGAVLLELMVSVAIFAVAGLTILATVRQGMNAVERARVLERGADLARTAMSELEAGLIAPESLSGPVDEDGLWELDVTVDPSEFEGLRVVTVAALQVRATGEPRTVFELTQLVRLGDGPDDTIGESPFDGLDFEQGGAR
jgi:type II secretory pathway pseudopilin PulG